MKMANQPSGPMWPSPKPGIHCLALLVFLLPMPLLAQVQGIPHRVVELETTTVTLTRTVAELEEENAAQQTLIGGLTREVAEQQTVISGLTRQVAEQETVIGGLTREVAEQQTVIGGLTREVSDQATVIGGLSREVADQEQVSKGRFSVVMVEMSRRLVEFSGTTVAAEITGRLSELQATATTGDNVFVAPDIADNVLDLLIVQPLRDIEPIDVTTLSQTVFLPDALVAAQDLNAWIAEIDLAGQRARLREQIQRAKIQLFAQNEDDLVAIDYLDGYIVPTLNDLVGLSSGAKFRQASASLAALSAKLDAALTESGAAVVDDAALTQADLQTMVQRQQQGLQVISNVAKQFHEAASVPLRGLL